MVNDDSHEAGAGRMTNSPGRAIRDGLVLRSPYRSEFEALADFNVRLHSDNPAEPELWLRHWTLDLLSGRHPTTGPDDFTVVVDENAGGAIVSTAVLIGQEWSYEGETIGCGRIELVATDAAYRRKGLVRAQLEALHARSAARGDLMQAITGIPWFYRQFGYEMAIDLDGYSPFVWERPGNLVAVDAERYVWRPAGTGDIPVLEVLYDIHCRSGAVWRQRDERLWRWELTGPHADSPHRRDFRLIETAAGEKVAYIEFTVWPPFVAVREMAVLPGHPWRPVLAFLSRALKAEADAHNLSAPKPVRVVHFCLSASHPALTALGSQLDPRWGDYAWYVRVADVPAFLRRVAPVLERRLAASVMAGHTGRLRLGFYTSHVTLDLVDGRLRDIGTYAPQEVGDGDALFPDLTFLQLLFGHRGLDDIVRARADCIVRGQETRLLVSTLFPSANSTPVALG